MRILCISDVWLKNISHFHLKKKGESQFPSFPQKDRGILWNKHLVHNKALREVQDELRNLAKKDLSVKEVWQELRCLFMSHDTKAKRQGYPELTDQQKVEYLIDSLRPRVQFLISWLRRQRHSDLATPSTAYAAALSCEKDLQKLDSIDQGSTTDLA